MAQRTSANRVDVADGVAVQDQVIRGHQLRACGDGPPDVGYQEWAPKAHRGESGGGHRKASAAEEGDGAANPVGGCCRGRGEMSDSHLVRYDHWLRSGVLRCVLQLPVWRIIDYGAESYKRRKSPDDR